LDYQLEVTVTPRFRLITAAAGAATLTLMLLPGVAEAQRAVSRGGAPAAPAHRAVPRPLPAHPPRGGGYVYRGPSVYRPYYASPYYWYGGFYGGYYAYPFYFSVGVGPGPYYWGYPYYPYPYPYGYAYDSGASLRLQVTPREAEVFVDGYYAGTVDDFDGSFQRLSVYPGDHVLEIYMPGYRSLQQKLYLQPGKTFTVKQALEPLAPGEPQPVRPSGAPRPGQQSRPPQGAPRPPEFNPAAPRGEATEFGALALRVQPGDASVTVDGNTWEAAADNGRLLVQLGAGVHTVEIRKDGYRTYITDITVRPGETTNLNVALTQQQ
jgi:hypothetical protein